MRTDEEEHDPREIPRSSRDSRLKRLEPPTIGPSHKRRRGRVGPSARSSVMRRLSPRQSVRHGHHDRDSSPSSPSPHHQPANHPPPPSPQHSVTEQEGEIVPFLPVVGHDRSPQQLISSSVGPLHEPGREDGQRIDPVFYVDASQPPPSGDFEGNDPSGCASNVNYPDGVGHADVDLHDEFSKGGRLASCWSTNHPLVGHSSSYHDDSSCATTEETSSDGSGSSHGMPPLSLSLEVVSAPHSQHLECDGAGSPCSGEDDSRNSAAVSTPYSPHHVAEGGDIASHRHPGRRRFELFGYELSHLPRRAQFATCASGVFGFTLVYGYLQELLSVHVFDREFALFFASCQFGLYALWAHWLRVLHSLPHEGDEGANFGGVGDHHLHVRGGVRSGGRIPWSSIIGLGLLRAIDLGATNLSMAYLNYPAKTLLKSSRVAFTMLMGIAIGKKRYRSRDYAVVAAMVGGLLIFLNADSRADDAYFHPLGVALLVLALLCDGAVSNYSESLMNRHNVGQDQYLFQLYSVSFLFLFAASQLNGEFMDGLRFLLLVPGTVSERRDALLGGGGAPADGYSWTPAGKASAVLLFATTGILGSSCAGAITKEFGALSMSVASTARKAATLFVSFAAFPDNVFTAGHGAGAALFLASLVAKSCNAAGAAEAAVGSSGGRRRGGGGRRVTGMGWSSLGTRGEVTSTPCKTRC